MFDLPRALKTFSGNQRCYVRYKEILSIVFTRWGLSWGVWNLSFPQPGVSSANLRLLMLQAAIGLGKALQLTSTTRFGLDSYPIQPPNLTALHPTFNQNPAAGGRREQFPQLTFILMWYWMEREKALLAWEFCLLKGATPSTLYYTDKFPFPHKNLHGPCIFKTLIWDIVMELPPSGFVVTNIWRCMSGYKPVCKKLDLLQTKHKRLRVLHSIISPHGFHCFAACSNMDSFKTKTSLRKIPTFFLISSA